MISAADIDRLQSYLDGALPATEVRVLETRLKSEVPLAQMLLSLAQEEAVLLEWSAAQAGIRSFSAGFSGTNQPTMGSNRHGPLPVPDVLGAPRPQEARIMLMQANCPGCRATLRIPAGWMHQPIRCKHCGMVIQLQQKAAVPPPAIPVGKTSVPLGQAAPPPAIMNRSPQAPPPAAIRMPAAPAGTYNKAQPRVAPRSGPPALRFAAIWLLVLGAIVATAFGITQIANQKSHDDVASINEPDEPANTPEQPKTKTEKVIGGAPAPAASTPADDEPKSTPKAKAKTDNKGKIEAPSASKTDEMPEDPKTSIRPPAPTPPKTKTLPIEPPKGNNTNTNTNTTPPRPPPGKTLPSNPANPNPVASTGGGTYPRRLLSINPNNYLYYNPISYGAKLRDTHELVVRMTNKFNIAPSQVTEISDAAPNAVPALKHVVDKALADFCNGSRAQDRIIILYSGHALEIEEEIYLVPMLGEAGDKDSLISLKSVFELLAKCKARQKILIMDVCRYNPSRGAERPDSGKMGEKLDKILAEPPAGVQIWSACVKDQNSNEDGNIINGGLFFNAMLEALANAPLPSQSPAKPFPVEELAKVVDKRTEADAKLYVKQEQTPRLAGEEITDGAAPPNASEAMPAPIKLEWEVKGQLFGVASMDTIQGILKETADIPPVKVQPEGVQSLRAETFPLFAAAILKDYKAEPAGDSEFRKTIVKATEALKKHAKSFQEDFRSTNVDKLKTDIQPVQKSLAATKLELEEALEEMVAAGEKREEEKNKRWQANYDYVLARLKMRMAYIFEYQYMLSEIRTDSLPERPEGSPGWRLASREKMQCKGPEGKEAKKNVEEAKKHLEKIGEEHKGTPWEILSKRESFTNLGLEWQPIGGGMAAEKAEKK